MVVLQTKSAGTIQITKSTLAQPYIGVTPLVTGSGNVANVPAVATLSSAATSTVYLAGFAVTGGGAGAKLTVLVTVAGLLGGTRSFVYGFDTPPTSINQPLILHFDPPLPASGPNTPIVITVPAGGTGNLYSMVFAHGYSTTTTDPATVQG